MLIPLFFHLKSIFHVHVFNKAKTLRMIQTSASRWCPDHPVLVYYVCLTAQYPLKMYNFVSEVFLKDHMP